MMASKQIDVSSLITHQFAFEDAQKAYDVLTTDTSGLGIILKYESSTESRTATTVILESNVKPNQVKPILAVIGAGNYASRVLIPAFKAASAQLHTLVTSGGVSGVVHGKKNGFQFASTDLNSVLSSEDVSSIVIATRHDSHAELVVKALDAGKSVFVEKPLAINLQELDLIEDAYKRRVSIGAEKQLMVGFNRRFSPQVEKMKKLLEPVNEPKSFIMTMNAGSIPADHWTQDLSVGGGRIIGEACHFIDLMRYLAGSKIISVSARRMGDVASVEVTEDKATITLGFEDGSFGTILYLANGSNSFPKERIEVFTAGRVLQLDNFRQLRGFGWPGFKKLNLWKQDKGQLNCSKAFVDAVEHGERSPIPFDELLEVARVSIEAAEILRRQSD